MSQERARNISARSASDIRLNTKPLVKVGQMLLGDARPNCIGAGGVVADTKPEFKQFGDENFVVDSPLATQSAFAGGDAGERWQGFRLAKKIYAPLNSHYFLKI